MTRVRVGVTIDAPAREVWAVLRDIPSHVQWMSDAVAIRMTSPHHEGVGTTFECDTRVGPLRTVDRMEVTRWTPGREMAIRHIGLVRGSGRFVLRGGGREGRTRFTWVERLRFPWWLGGPVGSWVAAPVLAHIWGRNVRNLKRLVEARVRTRG